MSGLFHRCRISIPALTAGFFLLLTTSLQAQSLGAQNLTVSGASPGGLWSALGVALDKAISQAYPGATITYQTSSGGLANAKLVSDNKVPLGIVSDMELKSAWDGTGVFRGKPQPDLRVLLRLFTAESRFQASHLIINRDYAANHHISSFADIITNKLAITIAVNRPGNMDGDTGIAVLDAVGLTADAIKGWGGQLVRASSGEQTGLMSDRRIDMANFGVSYNHATVTEMANALPVKMLDLPEPVANRVVANIGGKVCGFRKGEYAFLDQDVTTVCTGAVLVANRSMSEETAYALTKAVIQHLDAFKSAHRQLAEATSPASLAEGSVAPWHPGAERALREAGLLKQN